MHRYLPSRLPRPVLAIGALALLALSPAFAETATGTDVDWLKLFMGLLGGLALFLFGMEQMANGLKAAAGESLKTLMERLTKNRFMGAATGAFVTAVLNSSSVSFAGRSNHTYTEPELVPLSSSRYAPAIAV